MSDFKAKMHQMRFRLGLRSRPARGANSAPPDTLAGLKGPTSKGSEGRGGWEKEKGTGGRGEEGMRREGGRKGKGERKGKLPFKFRSGYATDCDQFVCLSVCVRKHICNRWTDFHEFCCADLLWPWLLGPSSVLAVLILFVRLSVHSSV